MQTDLERISALWREQSDTYSEHFTDEISVRAGASYAALPRAQLLEATKQLVAAWQTAFDTNDSAPIRAFAQQIGRRRSASHFPVDDIMRVVDITREIIWDMLTQIYTSDDWNIEIVAQIEDWLHEMRKGIVRSYGETFQEAEDSLAEREQAIAVQSQIIQELSTPIVPIYEGVLVVPLVGALDSRRATQVMESVLEQIVAQQADIIILDITGVPVVDTGVANHILQTMRAITLLGAQSVLVGIGSEIAQTLVQLGVDLSSITIRSNLSEGISYALNRLGMAIQPMHSR